MGKTVFIALTLLDALLLLAVIASGRRWWQAKLAAIVLVLGFNFLVWHDAGSFSGWPTRSDPPARSALVSCYIEEPDSSEGKPGTIYLWVVPIQGKSFDPLRYHPAEGEPRSFAMPYSRELHLSCVQAAKAMQNGATVGLRASRTKPPRGRLSGRPVPKWALHPYVLPTPAPPQKKGSR